MCSTSGITPSSTKETSNYARLCRLLVDVGSHVLRDTFDAIHPPSGLHATLSSHPVRARLESIFNGKQRILNQTQWEKLYPTNPSSVSSQHFDITLLMVLLRNISGLEPPDTGWNNSPDETDMSKEADIVRLKIFRNNLAHTTSQASVDDKTFGEYWQGIRQPLIRLGGKHYGPYIDKLRDEDTDPDIEVHCQEPLKQWTGNEVVIEEREGSSECAYAHSADISLLDPTVDFKSTSGARGPRIAVQTVTKSLKRLWKRKPDASSRYTASQMEEAPLKEDETPDGLSPKQGLNRISTKRFQEEEEYRVNKMVIERLEEAMNFHQSDHIAAARKNLQGVFETVSKFKGRYFKTPTEHGWRVVFRGTELFFEDNVSCSVKHGTVLLDSSNCGAQFYISLLNVIGAFAMVVSEFKIADEIFLLLTDLHQQSDVTSRKRDLGAAYNNRGCMALIMGNLKQAKNHFDTSLKHLNCEKRHHPNSSLLETMLIALDCNIARLDLLSRNFPEAIEKQEGLVKQCKAKEIQEVPLQVIFTVLNNQAVLCTTLGYLSKAEQELKWLISYLYKMNREECEFLLNFVSLHLAEVLLLQGRSKEAAKACRLDTLESADGTELVEMFGGLHINVRIEALEKLVEVIFLKGKIRCARRLLETGVEVLQKSFGPDHFNVASLLHKQGKILSRVGEFVSAADKMKCSIETLNEIFGVKHPLLLRCYMSLGELSLTLKRTDDSFLCFQRAMENVEEMYQVSFVHELSKKYMEITNSPKGSEVSMVRKDTLMIQGLIAEFGLAIAVLSSRSVVQDENSSLRRSKETSPRTATCTMKIISMKYAGDFVQSGHAFLRQDMNEEAAAFFQQAEKYCATNSKKESPSDPCLARFYSVLAKKSPKNHKPLDENGDLTDCLEELKEATTKVIPEGVSKPATEDAALEITDCHLNLKLVLIFLILVSIELKMIDTTFAAFDLYTKLPQNDNSFLLFLKSGVQIYTSRASITCNGNTAVQDVLVSSAAGFTEDDSECPTSENKLFRSLAFKKNVPSDRYLVTYNSSVLLDIDDLQVLESKISQSIQECFRLKCFETGVKDSATHVAVDLTSNITFDDHDILSTGRRIDLLSLCLSEELSTGVFHRGDISEISTYMHQKTTRLTFEDDQTCHFMFNKSALSLLQHHSPRQISTLSVQSQCLSITIVHPVKARLTLWRVDKCITQKIQLVQTAARHGLVSWRINELTSSLVGRCALEDIPSLPAIHHLAKEHHLEFLTDDVDSDEPLDVSIVPYQRNKIIFDGRHGRFVHISSQETEEIETLRMCLNDTVLEGLTFISDISREIYGGWRQEDGDVVEVSPDNSETSPSFCFAQRQMQQETILSGSQEVTFANPEFDAEAAPHSTAVEAGPWAREVELISMTKDDDSQLGRSLFEEDRRSRRSFIAELQENLKRKQTPNGVVNLEEAINKGSDIVSGVKKATGRHTLKSDELDDSSTQRTFSSFELPAFYPEDTEEEAHNLSEPWLQDKNSKAADNENALGRHIFEEDRNARSTSTARLKDLEPKMGKSSQTLNSLEDGNSPDGGITPGKQDCENQQHSGDTQKGESLPGAGASFQVEQEEYKPNSTETNVTNLIAKGSVNDPGLLNVYQLEARSLIQDQTQHQQQETPRNVHRSSACTSAYVDAKGNCQIEEVNDHGQSKQYEEEIRESQDENEPLRRKEFPQILPMTEATLDSRFQFDDVVSDGPSIGTSKRAQSNANHFMPLPNTDAVDRPSGGIGTNIRAKPVSKKETGVEAPRNGSQNTKRSQLLNKANKNTAILPHFCEFLGGDVLVDGNTTYISHNKEDVVDGPVKICQDGGNKEGVNAASSFQFDVARDVVDAPVHLPKVDTKIKNIPSDFGGARPKERSTNTIKSTSTIAYQYEGTETPGIHLDFWKRHAVNGSTLEEPFQEGYGDHYFSAKGVPCDENLRAPWELFSQPSYHSEETFLELFGKGDHANIRLSRGDGQSLIGYQKPSLPQNESWHFPPADTDEAIAMQSKYDDGQICTRRRNSTEFDFIGSKVEALFNSDNSQSEGLYTEMDSMANEYHSGARKIDNGPAQSSAAIARQQSSTEDCTSSLLGSLQHIMAKTVKLIASDKAVGKQPKEQKEKQETKRQEPKELEKLGIQEESREGNEEEPAVRPRVEDSIIQVESHQENEPAPETESQSIPTPVQESPRPVCSHYQRRCLVRFPCCGKFFPCHRCHNESEDCSDDQARAINATHIRCTICYHEQAIDEHSQTCSECKSKMSEYFCPTCKHFTSVDKNPFHCDKCGICRIHRDRSFHCDVCNVCLDKRLQGKHKCRPDSGHDECCICLEDAFSGCQILPCSHKVHKDCAIAMIQNGVRTCPICRHPLFSQPQNNSN